MLFLSCFVFYLLVCWPRLFLLLRSHFLLGFSCYWWCDKDFPLVALDWLQSWVFLAFWVVHIIRLFPDFWVVHIIRFWVFLIALLFNCCLSWLLRSKSLRGPPVFKITQFFFLTSKDRVLGPFAADLNIFVGQGCFFRLLLGFLDILSSLGCCLLFCFV